MIKRTPFVLAGTIAGLAGLLSFRSTPASMTLGTVAAAANAASSASATPTTTPAPAPSPGSGNTGATAPTTTVAQASPVAGVQSATGPLVNYYFGVLSVKVTASGTKVEKVTIKSINDGGNPLSQSIDQMSIPQLESQALAVQNANIQGVSGASYTSAGFKMSLQGALTKLGIK